MRKAKNNKSNREKRVERKLNKANNFNFIKLHTKIFNLVYLFSKSLERHLKNWDLSIEDDGYLNEEMYNLLKISFEKSKKIVNVYLENGYEVIIATQNALQEIFNDIISKYPFKKNMEDIDKKILISFIETTILIDSLREVINKIEKEKVGIQELVNYYQKYIDFFRAEIDFCIVIEKRE